MGGRTICAALRGEHRVARKKFGYTLTVVCHILASRSLSTKSRTFAKFILSAFCIGMRSGARSSMPPPHLIYIVADDLGTYDVPFTNSGSEILTPTLSRLANGGLVLDQYYVQPLCTPSRSSFMTGRHPVQLGLQHGVIRCSVPDAVPANETMLPTILRGAGYKTHFLVITQGLNPLDWPQALFSLLRPFSLCSD